MINRNVGRAFALAFGTLIAFAPGVSFTAQKPAGPSDAYGPNVRAAAVEPHSSVPLRRSSLAADGLRYWNTIAVDASGLDHTPVAEGEVRQFGEQLGPGRSSRAMAIVHIAIYDSVNAIVGGYERYTKLPRAPNDASINAAIATAAHDTLIQMFPSQKPKFDALYAADIANNHERRAQQISGVAVGRNAARLILAMRADDGAAGADPKMGTEWLPSDEAGHWRQDPIGLSQIALGAHWGTVKPFVLLSGDQFRVPAPPAMTSARYALAFNEVKTLGGDGIHTPTVRTADQTRTGIFWAYDGTPSLCAPPRLYNQLASEISNANDNVMELARLYALVNVSMADAGIAIWESKFFYDFWRPVTGVREADEGMGPTGVGDGNAATMADPTFWPLGAPASNLSGPGFTPPFPSYPSGHAGFGGALFETLRNVYRTDNIAFTFISDEYNGVTAGGDGVVRPLAPRSYQKLSQAEEENGQSRIYLGIHWSFDKTQGIRQGRNVADYVFKHAFRPAR
jgi:hypothetical protein